MDVERLAKFLGMLGSDHDGEVAAAARKAAEMLRSEQMTWPDLARRAFQPAAEKRDPPPPPPPPPPSGDERPRQYGHKASPRTATHRGVRARELLMYLDTRGEELLSSWEINFVQSLLRQVSGGLTERQWAVLMDIANKYDVLKRAA